MKKVKFSRVFAVLLALVIVVGTVPLTALSASAATTGDGLEFEVLNGEATITGYTGNSTELEVPTSIDGYPVTSIGEMAFLFEDFERITLSLGITSIERSAFANCFYLSNLNIPESVTSIGEGAFAVCSSLISVEIPANVNKIGEGILAYCPSIESITVDEKNASYYSDGNCLVEKETGTLLAGCKNSVIPNDKNIVSIGYEAFLGCTELKIIHIPDGVKSIGDWTFSGCHNLTSITIPLSMTTIGFEAFSSCPNLTTVFYGGTENQWNNISIDEKNENLVDAEIIFLGESEDLTVPSGLVYNVSDGEVTITDYTGNATELVIPDTIEGQPVKYIGDDAFMRCKSLTSVEIPEGVTQIGDFAFCYCYNIEKLILPNSVKSIGDSAFAHCINLTSITLPEGLISIGIESFYYCTKLTGIKIPKTVTSIGAVSFYECPVTIYGYSGSLAEIYANEYSIPFVDLDGEEIAVGDLNVDGGVNSMDVNFMKRVLAGVLTLTEWQMIAGDLNGDGQINSIDSNALSKIIAGAN